MGKCKLGNFAKENKNSNTLFDIQVQKNCLLLPNCFAANGVKVQLTVVEMIQHTSFILLTVQCT